MDDPTLPNLTVQQLEYLVAAAGSPTRAAAAASLTSESMVATSCSTSLCCRGRCRRPLRFGRG